MARLHLLSGIRQEDVASGFGVSLSTVTRANGGAKLDHGSGGMVPAGAEQNSASVSALSDDGEGGRIHTVELYRKVRLACRNGMSARGGAPFRGLAREREEDARVLRSAGEPTHGAGAPSEARWIHRAYRRVAAGDRKEDRRKLGHTAKRIFERLRDEHDFTRGYTIVKDYVREHHRRRREMYVPAGSSAGAWAG